MTTTTKKLPAKAVKASKKAPTHETHGALPTPAKPVNMIKLFGIKDGYTVDTLEDYTVQLENMLESELHDHAHVVGVVPLDPRDKLTASLKRKFTETKMAQRPPRTGKIAVNPAMAKWHKEWFAGDLR
jgi:hypothetical protein